METSGIQPLLSAYLKRSEAEIIRATAAALANRLESSDDPRLVSNEFFQLTRVPPTVTALAAALTTNYNGASLLIRGHLVDQTELGPTPAHWRERDYLRSCVEEMTLLLYATALGEPFAWATQQDGHLVHNVIPIQADEHEQLGSGSKSLLTLHTEDAFAENRGTYVLLMCLRNPQHVATLLAVPHASQLPQDLLGRLFEKRYFILPDHSHLPTRNSPRQSAHNDQQFQVIEEFTHKPAPVAILSGNRTSPSLRYEPYYMDWERVDDKSKRALVALDSNLKANLLDIVLAPGDILVINNDKAVHGRRPFSPKYDGTDRWLKRVNVRRKA